MTDLTKFWWWSGGVPVAPLRKIHPPTAGHVYSHVSELLIKTYRCSKVNVHDFSFYTIHTGGCISLPIFTLSSDIGGVVQFISTLITWLVPLINTFIFSCSSILVHLVQIFLSGFFKAFGFGYLQVWPHSRMWEKGKWWKKISTWEDTVKIEQVIVSTTKSFSTNSFNTDLKNKTITIH